ncbi:hypothetical protein SIL74_09205 [Zymomonas mobilis subsp. pomaceae]|uniref:hypothetical protein n=1 Tax=Zymomonas mobilis TaxID=542 RepID=UPI0021003063|nr:hypothetical protein [Zymomonas mobilis]MDX5949559.1 hypothetical protein [Zymomonas mobilis subsp. pomaceae]
MFVFVAGQNGYMGYALLETLVELGVTDDWQDNTVVRGYSPSVGAKRGLIRKALAEVTEVLRVRSMLVLMVRDALLALK